ncbi:MAG: M15 family metallopeptidase [Proteobacteria bacterium]|nr:M15 family metallopeptidase [Pseudomonadota bacterium]
MAVTAALLRAIGPAGALVVALAASAGGAPQGLLLSASVEAEHFDAFRAGLAEFGDVTHVADIARARIAFVATRDADGVAVDTVPGDGYRYLLDGLAFDPASFGALLGGDDGALAASLGAGEALLSETSALVRRLRAGAVIELVDGSVLTVRGVVPDDAILRREIAVADPNLAEGESRRSILIRFVGPEDGVVERMEALLPEDARFRLRSLTPSDFVPGFAAVLPQAEIKRQLGEFAYRPTDGRNFRRDAAWEAANMVIADVPLLGQVRCHRVLIPALVGAMNELVQDGLSELIEPSAFRGCDNPRLIAEGRGISPHAWGAAVDLNYGDDPRVQANAQDPRLVAIMSRWGFTSGHLFGNSDPGHFEYVGPPSVSVATAADD